MFKLIKFVFWVSATICLAYFMTDFQIGGKTVKQRIDAFIQSDEGGVLKIRAKELANRFIGATLGKDDLNKPLPEAAPEDIKPEERTQLEKLIKGSQ